MDGKEVETRSFVPFHPLRIHCAQIERQIASLGLAWLGLAWLAWLGLAWLGLAWLGLAPLGLASQFISESQTL